MIYIYSGRQGRHASFVPCTDPDDIPMKESMTSGADAERDNRTDAKNRVIEDSDVVQRSQKSPSVACTLPVPPGTVTTVRRSGRTFILPKRLDL